MHCVQAKEMLELQFHLKSEFSITTTSSLRFCSGPGLLVQEKDVSVSLNGKQVQRVFAMSDSSQ